MKYPVTNKSISGFSLLELMISMCVLLPVMGAAVSLFSVGAGQHTKEQSSISANQEVRSAFEMMTTEIGQAGSHGDRNTTLTAGIPSSATPQPAYVASTVGFTQGDYVDVDYGNDHEVVQLTAVGTNSITGVFRTTHAAGRPVRLFAIPYLTGILPVNGMGANSTATVTTLRFFGDINGDSTVQYVEYAYTSNGTTAQITRSITPISQATRNPVVVLVANLIPTASPFIITTDGLGVVTSATIQMTARNQVKSGSQYEQTEMASRITIPSAMAASVLLDENRRFGGFNRLPPTPSSLPQ
jgi:type II secretory pathway pseudopilin PulG